MAGEREGGGEGRFLPPEPGGPEPDLAAPTPQPPPPPQPYPAPQPQPQPGWGQPPPAWQQPPAAWQQPQPGPQQPQPAWQQPAQPWVYQPQPAGPDNGPAVAGFVLSITAAVLLVLSAGLSSVISIVCAGLGIGYSRKGKKRVDRGETPKHRGLAQAGFVTGIVTLVLALLATAFWGMMVALYATDEEFRRDFENDLENSGSDGIRSSIALAGTAGRVAWSLVT